MSRLSVIKCICHDRNFEELKKYAAKRNIDSVEELEEQSICSCGCGMCKPYIEQMLKTGETAFEPGGV